MIICMGITNMYHNKRRILFIIYFMSFYPIFSWEPPHAELMAIKNNIGDLDTSIEAVVSKYGNQYKYSEIDAYGSIPNAEIADKVLVFDYNGLKYMFFHSNKRDRNFMYFWEVTNDDYLIGTKLYLGMPLDEAISRYGKTINSSQNLLIYNFKDSSSVTLKFNNSELEKVYWFGPD